MKPHIGYRNYLNKLKKKLGKNETIIHILVILTIPEKNTHTHTLVTRRKGEVICKSRLNSGIAILKSFWPKEGHS